MTHTKTPWRTGDMFHTVFGPPNGNPAPEIVATNIKKAANAQLIVTAVNSYEAMKEALETALNLEMHVKKAEQHIPVCKGLDVDCHFNKIRQALAIANGKEGGG